MRVLFIEAPFSYGSASSLVGTFFPLGIGYLAAYLRQHGHTVSILQPEKGEDFDASLRTAVNDFRPELVAVSVMTPSYPEAVRICDLVKTLCRCQTVLGGHHVSAVGQTVLEQSPQTDFAVVGEGEETLHELVEALSQSVEDFSQINGLVWRDATGAIHRNSPRSAIRDVDSLPFPARDLANMDRFRPHSYIDFGKRSATMVTSRGCPFKCMFCSSWLAMGSKYRWRSVENVLAEIRELVEVYGVDHLVFEDDTMTLRRDRIFDLCTALEEMPRRPSWYGLSRVDTMDIELARKMKSAGCRMVGFGIESGSPEILEKIGKRISLDKAAEAVSACNRAGLRTQCTFILGFPFDTDETMKMTLDAAKRINPTIAIFFPLTPYPGTKVFDEFMDPKRVPQSIEDWKQFVSTGDSGAISVNPQYDGKEIWNRARLWNRRYHLRPAHWIRMLRTVANPGEALRLARGGMYLASTMLRR